MAKVNFPAELEALLQEYLTDGIISVKEREVLLKKAQQLGVDVDEFDLYIDAQQQKIDQAIDTAVAKKRGKTCPFCGGLVPQLTDKCPHCGQLITAEASEDLKKKLDRVDELYGLYKVGGRSMGKTGVELMTKKEAYYKLQGEIRKLKSFYGNNPRVQEIISETEEEMRIEQEKDEKEDKKSNRIFHIVVIVIASIFLMPFLIGILQYLSFFF